MTAIQSISSKLPASLGSTMAAAGTAIGGQDVVVQGKDGNPYLVGADGSVKRLTREEAVAVNQVINGTATESAATKSAGPHGRSAKVLAVIDTLMKNFSAISHDGHTFSRDSLHKAASKPDASQEIKDADKLITDDPELFDFLDTADTNIHKGPDGEVAYNDLAAGKNTLVKAKHVLGDDPGRHVGKNREGGPAARFPGSDGTGGIGKDRAGGPAKNVPGSGAIGGASSGLEGADLTDVVSNKSASTVSQGRDWADKVRDAMSKISSPLGTGDQPAGIDTGDLEPLKKSDPLASVHAAEEKQAAEKKAMDDKIAAGQPIVAQPPAGTTKEDTLAAVHAAEEKQAAEKKAMDDKIAAGQPIVAQPPAGPTEEQQAKMLEAEAEIAQAAANASHPSDGEHATIVDGAANR